MPAHLGNTLTPLVGRERELRTLESKLAKGARLVTLLGPGGSGKTRLARELFDRRPPGAEAYFVDLVGIRDPDLVPAEIATELGVTETAELDAAAAVVMALRERSPILVLDNLEELTGARDFLAGLLQASPALQLLATSRIPLGIPGEVEFHVPPLELPQGDGPAEVEASPAGTLFLERARAVGRLDEVDAPTAQAIAELCRRLDGLPLALELAAARTRILPPASILRHLAEHTSGLLAKADGADGRHESLDAVLSWSIDLLGGNEREVLSAVAICPGGFDLAMAEALAPDLNVLRAIDLLATHGLLTQRDEVGGEPWFRLLETIRMTALERVPEEITAARWKQLATHLSAQVAGCLEAFFMLDEVVFQRLDALLDDIRAVLDWSELYDPPLNLSMAAHFAPYWRIRGGSREGLLRLRAAVAASPKATADLALALVGVAGLEYHSGGPPEVRRAATEAARLARLVGDQALEILSLADLTNVADGPMSEVSIRLLELLPSVKDPASRHLCLVSLANCEALEAGYESATLYRLYGEAEAALSGTRYRRLQGMAAANVAQNYLYAGRPMDAFEHATRGLAALRDVGPVTLAWLHSLRATAASMSGRFLEAKTSLALAFESVDSGGATLVNEVMVAAVAVLAVSDAPLLAARAWGATIADTATGPDFDLDRSLVASLLVTARRATDPVAFEIAVKAGQRTQLVSVMDEVRSRLDGISSFAGHVGQARLPHGTLTQRELEVLGLVGAGKSDGDIAAALFISPKTASVHVSNAKAKLGVETRLEAALWARERGLVDVESDTI